jgi:hypothetical protein
VMNARSTDRAQGEGLQAQLSLVAPRSRSTFAVSSTAG